MKPAQIIDILNRLGFDTKRISPTKLSCTVPSWRLHDVQIKEDLAEEITRVYGYFRLPSILPITQIPKIGTSDTLIKEEEILQHMVKLGYTEVYNSSLLSKEQLNLTPTDKDAVFELSNPLSSDNTYMRPSLIPSLIQNALNNRGNNVFPAKIIEISNVYHKQKNNPLADESPNLGLITIGFSYRQIVGDIENLFHRFNLNYSIGPLEKPHLPFDQHKTGQIFLDKKPIGLIGYCDPKLNNKLQLPEETIMTEVNLAPIIQAANLIHHFTPVSPYAPIIEDLTFTLPLQTPIGTLIALIENMDPLISSVDLKDQYNQNFTFTVTYQSDQNTLSSEEIAPIRKKIVQKLQEKHIKLVGQLD